MYEEVRQLVVIANLPGVKREHLDIDVHGDIMAVEATRKDSSGQVHHYHRELLLPVVVNDVPVDVAFEDGLLEVRLKPKAPDRQADEQ
ncbi:MAG: Hsp20/alpha crystallin family protein [Candidatus Brocadiae bacterium]|nr:Hsp20/alpha crystallin family protein [Candidatus Brocadiia bacterium]